MVVTVGVCISIAEEIPVVEEAKPTEVVEAQPKVQLAELKFTRPLQPALTPNEERVVEYVLPSSMLPIGVLSLS